MLFLLLFLLHRLRSQSAPLSEWCRGTRTGKHLPWRKHMHIHSTCPHPHWGRAELDSSVSPRLKVRLAGETSSLCLSNLLLLYLIIYFYDIFWFFSVLCDVLLTTVPSVFQTSSTKCFSVLRFNHVSQSSMMRVFPLAFVLFILSADSSLPLSLCTLLSSPRIILPQSVETRVEDLQHVISLTSEWTNVKMFRDNYKWRNLFLVGWQTCLLCLCLTVSEPRHCSGTYTI